MSYCKEKNSIDPSENNQEAKDYTLGPALKLSAVSPVPLFKSTFKKRL